MGFLDNSGDIILDAVLTDTGRMRMAKGDGTFKIAKYAFGDDEIDYGNYNATNPSGSAYYDLEILQTPILEAFTNNRSSLKHKLVTMTNNNLLFLPEIVLNDNVSIGYKGKLPPPTDLATGSFIVAVDATTVNTLTGQDGGIGQLNGRFIVGTAPQTTASPFIRVDQGLNTTKLSAEQQLSAELREQQYLVQIDNRLGRLTDPRGQSATSPAFIDDDQIASYYFTLGVGGFVELCTTGPRNAITAVGDSEGTGGSAGDFQVLDGPRGTNLLFSIQAQSNVQASTFLFETLGTTKNFEGVDYFVIDSTVKVTGVTTGYTIDLPVRYVKQQT